MDEILKRQLPQVENYDREALLIIPVYDVANNKLHYQTQPFLDRDGKIKVKRLVTYDVIVEPVHNIIEEYDLPSKGEDNANG